MSKRKFYLSKRCKELRLRQQVVAKAVGIHPTRFSQIVNGTGPTGPTRDEIEKLVFWFNMPESRLFKKENNRCRKSKANYES